MLARPDALHKGLTGEEMEGERHVKGIKRGLEERGLQKDDRQSRAEQHSCL